MAATRSLGTSSIFTFIAQLPVLDNFSEYAAQTGQDDSKTDDQTLLDNFQIYISLERLI